MQTDPQDQEREEREEEGSDYESTIDAMLSESVIEDQEVE